VKASASGSTVRHTSPGKILEVEVKLPTLEEQREIVSFALSLDRSFETGITIAAPMMRGMTRGAIDELNASLRTDLLSGRVRVPE
jgi:type I restriction enzyme S subunit